MVTRICDEVPERSVYRDTLGIVSYGGYKGLNYTFKAHTGFSTEILFQSNLAVNAKADGLTPEVLLATLIDRLRIDNELNPCRETTRALANMLDALSF